MGIRIDEDALEAAVLGGTLLGAGMRDEDLLKRIERAIDKEIIKSRNLR
jgi:hypothetical protein